MSFASMHPSQQIAAIMNRLYRNGLTTLSGGNLSIRDEDGSLWITPAGLGITPTGVDKGNLKPEDVAHILPDGSTEGAQRPSSEYPFHSRVYTRRPDVRAVVHAHSSALVSFCLVHRVPEVTAFPAVYEVCKSVGYVPYALPGSPDLAQKIGDCFATGVENVILRNHGIVSAGPDLLTAFQRLEALEYAARIEIKARALGGLVTLTDEQLGIARQAPAIDGSDSGAAQEPAENDTEIREKIVEVVRRACGRGLMLSTQGVISARLGDDDFLITPHDIDRESLTPGDLVRVIGGKCAAVNKPDPSAALHRAIYKHDPEVNSIVSGQPPHIMAYAVSTAHFDTRTIPESYTLLVDLPSLPFETPYMDVEAVAGCIGVKQPVVMIRSDRVIAVGRSILQAFDRLEVAETSARSLIESAPLGPLQPIRPEDLDQLTQFIPRL